jgi:4-hydroxybenzoate polyprenyltransferase
VIGCSLISLLILLSLNMTAVLLGVGSLALVAAYPFMKRITWWPQAWLGLTFNWGALMGFAAALPAALLAANLPGGRLASPFGANSLHDAYIVDPGPQAYLPAVLVYLAGVFWTLGYDTIYALQDIEDDAMVGVKSSARRLGRNVRRGVGIFYILSVLAAILVGTSTALGPLFWLGLAAFATHLGWQVARLKPDNPALALRLFRSNRDAGFILLSAIILGAVSWPF